MPPLGVSLRTFRKWLLDGSGLETGFTLGMVRDVERWRIPENGSYTLIDFLIDQPGELRKRGGTEYQCGPVTVPGATGGQLWTGVACPEYPGAPRVLGIASDGGSGRYLVDVSDQATPGSPISIGIEPYENPSTFITGSNTSMLILTSGDPSVIVAPKKVLWDGTQIQVSDLGGGPPNAKVSAKANSYFTLANDGGDHQNRIWWSAGGDPEQWFQTGTSASFLDLPEPVMAMIEFQGSLLAWTRHGMYRLLGDIPPGHPSGNTKLQPVTQIGCIDARSVVKTSTGVFFANEEGVYLTDGASVTSLTLGKGQAISGLWREIMNGYSVKMGNVISAGLYQDLFLLVTVVKGVNSVATLICYLPTGGWALLTNPCAGAMYANSLSTSTHSYDLYSAYLWPEPNGQIRLRKLGGIFTPDEDCAYEADGTTPVEPVWESRVLPGGATGLRRFGNGRLVYGMASGGNPSLKVLTQLGLMSEGTWHEVKEGSPLPKTVGIERKRFRIFKNAMGVKLRVEQHGASDTTSLLGVEYELGTFFTAEEEGDGEGL